MRPLLLFLVLAQSLCAQKWKPYELYPNDPALKEDSIWFNQSNYSFFFMDSVSYFNGIHKFAAISVNFGGLDTVVTDSLVILEKDPERGEINRIVIPTDAYVVLDSIAYSHHYGSRDSLFIFSLYPDYDLIENLDIIYAPYTDYRIWSQHYPVKSEYTWIYFAEQRKYSYESYLQTLKEISQNAYAQGADRVSALVYPYPDYTWTDLDADPSLAPKSFLDNSQHILIDFIIRKGQASLYYSVLMVNEEYDEQWISHFYSIPLPNLAHNLSGKNK